jgi:hypothetical protein
MARPCKQPGQKKAPPEEICKLFKAFFTSEMIKQVKTQQIKAEQMAKQVCDLAAWGTPGSIYPQAPIYAPVAQCTEKTLMPGVPCVD